MIGECLDEEREFGILWLADDELKEVGCAARITRVLERFEDGRLNILVEGTTPFRLERRIDDLAYPAGDIELLDDEPTRTTTRSSAPAPPTRTWSRRSPTRGRRPRRSPGSTRTAWPQRSTSTPRPSRRCSSSAPSRLAWSSWRPVRRGAPPDQDRRARGGAGERQRPPEAGRIALPSGFGRGCGRLASGRPGDELRCAGASLVSPASSCCWPSPARAQAARYDAHTVIVKFASGVSQAQRAALFSSAGVTGTTGHVAGVGADVVTVSGDPAAVARAAEPQRARELRGAELHPEGHGHRRTTRCFRELYGLNNTGQTGGTPDADIDAPEGWDAAGLGGFPATRRREGRHRRHRHRPDPSRAERQGRRLRATRSAADRHRAATCADDNVHGTHVAGTIAAKANNGTGVAGVAFNVAAVDLQGAPAALGPGLDLRRRQLHHLGRTRRAPR